MKTMLSKQSARRKILLLRVVLALVVFGVLVARPAADDDLCFNFAAPVPSIDGVVQGDGGWRHATQYVFGNMGPSPHAIVQFTRTSTDAYLSFEINNDPYFNDLDFILITLSPGGGAANDRRILIFPVAENAGNANAAPGGNPREVKYWTNSSTWNTSPAAALPTWLTGAANNIKVTSSPVLSLVSYVVEMKIPISSNANNGVNLPASGPFGLYFNIVRLNAVGDALGELKWPSTEPDIGGMLPAPIAAETNTPAPPWGQGQMASTCAGVKVTSVNTNHPTDSNAIDPNSTNNRFTVHLQNTGTAAANGITATIKSMRFGLGGPNSFGPLPVPPAGPVNLSAGGATSVQTQAWDVLNDPNRATYLTWPNVCSFVELNAASGLIADRYYYWNLHFATASRFQHTAVIDARRLPAPPGQTRQRFDLYVDERRNDFTVEDYARAAKFLGENRRRVDFDEREFANPRDAAKAALLRMLEERLPKEVEALRAKRRVATLTRFVHGYLHTGRFIEIQGKRYRLKDPVNSYGYVIVHRGAVGRWRQGLKGPTVRPLPRKPGSPQFIAETPINGDTTLATTIEPETGGRGGRALLRFSTTGGLMAGLIVIGIFVRRRSRHDTFAG